VELALMAVIDQADRAKRNAIVEGVKSQTRSETVASALFEARSNDELRAFVQHIEEHAKTKLGHQPIKSVTTMNDAELVDWFEKLKNYYMWCQYLAMTEQGYVEGRTIGIPIKTAGNVADCLPALGQLGTVQAIAESTEGISVIIAGVLTLIGHLSEGIIYIKRTSENALL
jgi:hypothetical protein